MSRRYNVFDTVDLICRPDRPMYVAHVNYAKFMLCTMMVMMMLQHIHYAVKRHNILLNLLSHRVARGVYVVQSSSYSLFNVNLIVTAQSYVTEINRLQRQCCWHPHYIQALKCLGCVTTFLPPYIAVYLITYVRNYSSHQFAQNTLLLLMCMHTPYTHFHVNN